MTINIEIDGGHIEILGEYRCQRISMALAEVAEEEARLSYMLAVSGAMRWPLSMRPEVVIVARCDVL